MVETLPSDISDTVETPKTNEEPSQRETSPVSDGIVQSVGRKKLGFIRLKDWEEERFARHASFFQLLDPVYEGLQRRIAQSQNDTAQTMKFLREFGRAQQESSRLMNACWLKTGGRPCISAIDSGESLGGSSNLMFSSWTPPLADEDLVRVDGMNSYPRKTIERQSSMLGSRNFSPRSVSKKSCGGLEHQMRAFLSSFFPKQRGEPWIAELMNLNGVSAKDTVTFGKFIDRNLVDGYLTQMAQEYEKRAIHMLEQTRKRRSVVVKLQESCVILWNAFEGIFKEVERGDIEESMSHKNSRKYQCCWLYERRYLFAARQILIQDKQYINCLVRNVFILQQLEQWRFSSVRKVLNTFVSKYRSSLDSLIRTIGLLEVSLQTAGHSTTHHTILSRPRENDFKIRIKDAPAEESTYKYLGISDTRTDKGGPPIGTAIMEKEPFSTAFQQLDLPPIPPCHFVIRRGDVQRTSGMGFFQKWTPGVAVLTWDRFLHMFKSSDAPSPVWSACLAHVEPRVEKSKPLILELKEKRKSYGVATRNVFKVETHEELDEWMQCLEVICDGENFFSSSKNSFLERVSKARESLSQRSQMQEDLSTLSSIDSDNEKSTSFGENRVNPLESNFETSDGKLAPNISSSNSLMPGITSINSSDSNNNAVFPIFCSDDFAARLDLSSQHQVRNLSIGSDSIPLRDFQIPSKRVSINPFDDSDSEITQENQNIITSEDLLNQTVLNSILTIDSSTDLDEVNLDKRGI